MLLVRNEVLSPGPQAAPPQALSDDLTISYYAEGWMEGCIRDYMMRCFPPAAGSV
jgi:hypothetical protein